ncbi:hypothetical protein DL96DRAFT_1818684 [Flagelloscypha sp. PMI_526]|nr:hypothetical protein DL96DRAFT_1818684 [Flagelloscypha sp. PMI_526]
MGIVPQLDFPAATAFYYTGSINILLVDVIVVWRAYALLPHNPKLRTLLLALLIITLFFNVFVLIYSSDPQRYLSLSESVQSRLYIARDVMVLLVTVLGLASIWWITWVYEMAAKASQFRNRQNTTSFISRIPRALIEGCVLLALLQVATICHDFAHKGSALRFVLISEITIIASASAIHPCLVTIIIMDESYSTKSASTSEVLEADLGSFDAAPPTMACSAV